jgi:hypothetical protein
MPTFNIHPEIRPEFDIALGTDTARIGEGSVAGRISPIALMPQDFGLSNAPLAGAHPSFTGTHGARVFTFPNDNNVYRVMESQSTSTFLQLGVFNPKEGMVKPVPKTMVPDGRGGWRLDSVMPGGGKGHSRHDPESAPLFGSSGANSDRSSSGHSFSNRSGWGNASTASPGASAGASSSSSSSGWSNPSTGSRGAPAAAGSGAPPLPPRNPPASASSSRSGTSRAGAGSDFGPVPDQRYLKDSGDGASKHWVIANGRGGYKPADSSVDRYGLAIHILIDGPNRGKGVWRGPHSSISPPPSSTPR